MEAHNIDLDSSDTEEVPTQDFDYNHDIDLQVEEKILKICKQTESQ